MTEYERKITEQRLSYYKSQVELYIEAEKQILLGAQQYSVGSRSLTRANLAEIRKDIEEFFKLIEKYESQLNGNGRMRQLGGVPIDS